MSRKSKSRKSTKRELGKKMPKLQKEIKAKKKESKAKLLAWQALPKEQWSEARKAHG